MDSAPLRSATLKKVSQSIKLCFQTRSAPFDPIRRHRKPVAGNLTDPDPTNLLGPHEPTFFENLDVLNDRRECDTKRRLQRRNGLCSLIEEFHYPPAVRVAKSLKNAIGA